MILSFSLSIKKEYVFVDLIKDENKYEKLKSIVKDNLKLFFNFILKAL